MPSKKKHTRAAQLHPQPAHSDYDTDTAANITDAAPLPMAPPPRRTNTELNLLVLRRYMPSIERIIAIAPFAVVYLFSPETQQWEKSGHEGTLFVCQLSSAEFGYPRYNVFILNRKSLDNFVTELVSGEDIEITEQYVILQVTAEDGTPNIYGLWIFSDDEGELNTRQMVASAIQECAVRGEHSSAMAGGHYNGHSDMPSYHLGGVDEPNMEEDPTPVLPQSTEHQVDLLSLLRKPSPSPYLLQSQSRTNQSLPQQSSPHLTRFTSTADTDFFRSSQGPATTAQRQDQPPPQQNVLLDLFKSASRG